MSRTRKEFSKVSEIKQDPEMRLSFPKEHYEHYIHILKLGKRFAIHPANICKHLALIFARKMKEGGHKEMQDRIMTELMQSLHGIQQINMFQSPEQWEKAEIENNKARNISKDGRLTHKKKLVKKKSIKKPARVTPRLPVKKPVEIKKP